MTLTETTIAEIAELLDRAELEALKINKLTTWFPRMDLEDAYAIQRAVTRRREAVGHRVVGFRLVSPDESTRFSGLGGAYGVFYQSSICVSGGGICSDELVQPRIAPTLALLTKLPIRGRVCTREEILGAVDSVIPAFDVRDCRYQGWDADRLSFIADNCFTGRIVLGQMRCAVGRFDGRASVAVTRSGKTIVRTTAAGALEDLAAGIAWMARVLEERADELPAGSVVVGRAIAEPMNAAERDRFTAHFDGLGSVSIRFVSVACLPVGQFTVSVKEH